MFPVGCGGGREFGSREVLLLVNYKKSFNARKITKKVITKPIMKKNKKNHWA